MISAPEAMTPRTLTALPDDVAGVIALCRRSLDRDESTLTSEQALASQCLPIIESLAGKVAEATARAADRDRYVQGMANWKATAEAKDKQLASQSEEIKALRKERDAVNFYFLAARNARTGAEKEHWIHEAERRAAYQKEPT